MKNASIRQIGHMEFLDVARADPGIDKGRIYCFERFLVYGAGSNTAINWRTSKTEELFAFLVQNRSKIISRSRIIQALWPEFEEERSIVNLHTTIYTLKKALYTAGINFELVFINGGYQLTLPDIYLDTIEFAADVKAELMASVPSIYGYEAVNNLYRGRYLDANEYVWAESKGDEYALMYHQLVAEMYKLYTYKHDYERAEDVLQRALIIDPIDDSFNEMLLNLFVLKKDKAAFVRHYNKVKKVYNIELGITLNSSMKVLLDKVMNQ